MRRLLVLVCAIVFVATGASAAAQESGGSISIRLLDAPTNRADDPRAKTYIVDHVSPGTTISRRVEIGNSTPDPQRIETYAAAASVRDGSFRFGDGRARNELTTWTKVDPAETALAAGENRPVTVTIVVPEDASEGERYAVVWAAVSAAAPTGGGIGAVNRVGIRIYLSVGPGGEPASDFEITSITARRVDGRPEVTARVENTGGRALDLAGTLQLTDGPGALRAGPFNAELGTTLGVGDSQSVRVQLDKALPDGPWKASLTLKSGLTERSASATITFPKAGSKTVATDDAGGASPFVAIGAAAGALGLGALLLLFFKRRNRRAPEDD